MPTYWCTNLLLLLFQFMKRNSKSKKKLPRILYSACPGQELHKCLAWQCLATTVWNIVKHGKTSSARSFWLFLFLFLYGRLQPVSPSLSGTSGLLAFAFDEFREAIASKHYPSLALRIPPCLQGNLLDNLIQLAVFHQFAELGSLDRTAAHRKLTKRILHFFRAPNPNLRDVQANKGKTFFLRRVSSLIFARVERAKQAEVGVDMPRIYLYTLGGWLRQQSILYELHVRTKSTWQVAHYPSG